MKRNKLSDAFEYVNDEHINSAADALSGKKRYPSFFPKKQIATVAAACLVLVLFAVGGISLALDVAAYNEAKAYCIGKGINTDELTRQEIINIYKDDVKTEKDNTSSGLTSSEDESNNEPSNMYTEEETVAFVKRAINNDLWYKGEYSELYDLVGNTYTMRYCESIGAIDTILYNTEKDYAWYVAISTPWDQADSEIYEAYKLYGYDLTREIELKTQEMESECETKALEYEISFNEPSKPVYSEETDREELEIIKHTVAKTLCNGGITGDATLYVRNYVHPEETNHKMFTTDVFIEVNGLVLHAEVDVDLSYIYFLNMAPEGGYIFDLRLLTQDSEKYHYTRVKETTDIILTVNVAEYMTNYYKNELIGFWHREALIPAAYFDHYRFFENGTFIFNYNFGDGLRRKLTEYGTWSVKSNTLTLEITAIDWLDGGEIIHDELFIGDYIEGGTVRTEILKAPVTKTFDLKYMHFDETEYLDGDRYMTAVFGGEDYWRLNEDPHGEDWTDTDFRYPREYVLQNIKDAVALDIATNGENSKVKHLIGNTYTLLYFEYIRINDGVLCMFYDNISASFTRINVSFPNGNNDLYIYNEETVVADSPELMMKMIEYDRDEAETSSAYSTHIICEITFDEAVNQ